MGVRHPSGRYIAVSSSAPVIAGHRFSLQTQTGACGSGTQAGSFAYGTGRYRAFRHSDQHSHKHTICRLMRRRSVSWLQYAFRLVQLPIGMFGVAISIASLPLLAKQASQNKIDELRQTFVSALTMVMALCLPASIGLIILAEPIIAVIFEHGAFTSADTRATAMALSLYAVGLFGYAANKVVVPVFTPSRRLVPGNRQLYRHRRQSHHCPDDH